MNDHDLNNQADPPSVWTEAEITQAVNEACSCGGKGPEDGCCQACEVWHRLNGRKVRKSTP